MSSNSSSDCPRSTRLTERIVIHPTALVSPEVRFEGGATVGPYAVLDGRILVGAGAHIGAHCLIGGRPKIRSYTAIPEGEVRIGRSTVISELCAVDSPTGAATEIGDECYIMPHCYIGHDSRLEQSVTLTAGCSLGGHVWIGEGATLGLGTVVHQFSSIGALAMIGMSATVNRDVPPFAIVRGNPARRVGVNRVGLQRSGLNAEEIEAIASAATAWQPNDVWPLERSRHWVVDFASATRRAIIRTGR